MPAGRCRPAVRRIRITVDPVSAPFGVNRTVYRPVDGGLVARIDPVPSRMQEELHQDLRQHAHSGRSPRPRRDPPLHRHHSQTSLGVLDARIRAAEGRPWNPQTARPPRANQACPLTSCAQAPLQALGRPRKTGHHRVRAHEVSTYDGRRKTRATPVLPRNSPAARSTAGVLPKGLVRAIEHDAAGWKAKCKETACGGLAVNVIGAGYSALSCLFAPSRRVMSLPCRRGHGGE
jgi:hypothetical protein